MVLMGVGALLTTGVVDDLSLMKEFDNRADVFWSAVARHAVIVGVSLGCTLTIGLPLGAAAHHSAGVRRVLMPVLNVLQTIPSIALFGLLIAPLAWLGTAVPALGQAGVSGVGLLPAVMALTLYGLLPVVRGVLTGMAALPTGVLQAARSLGLSGGQTLRWVALPLALPVVLAGVRTAAVQLVGLAAVAALIGAGGLGAILFEGLFSAAQEVVLLAVLPLVVMGVLVDASFSVLARMTRVARVRALLESAGRMA
jgi:osmoprotectant transport system permease protein